MVVRGCAIFVSSSLFMVSNSLVGSQKLTHTVLRETLKMSFRVSLKVRIEKV